MVSLRNIKKDSKQPGTWFGRKFGIAIPNNDDGLLRREMPDNFADRSTTIVWQNVTLSEAAGGWEKGTSCIDQAKKAHKRLTRRGRQQQANCLEAVV